VTTNRNIPIWWCTNRTIEQHVLETNAGKQAPYTATDV
jgi:hypothetical protein